MVLKECYKELEREYLRLAEKCDKLVAERGSQCWFCGSKLIWQSDFMPEDIGIEGDGLVSMLTCSGCGASWEGIQIDDPNE